MTKKIEKENTNEAANPASNHTHTPTPTQSNVPVGDFEEHNLEQDKTEVFDDIDMASNLALGYAEQAWKNHRNKMASKVLDPDFDGVHCIGCDEPIPPKRLEMHVDRCTECQELQDKIDARRR